MSKATVNETMKALRAKNAVEVEETDEKHKALKHKEALHNLAEKKKNGASKRKQPAKRTVVSSDDEEDVQEIPQGTIKNKRIENKKKKSSRGYAGRYQKLSLSRTDGTIQTTSSAKS